MISQFLLSLITGLFVGGVSGYLGSLMITKRMALVGDALGHVALPGIGLALFFGLDVSIGAVFFLLIGVLIIWFLESRTNLSAEALVGVLFVVSLALGFLIIPDFELLE
ncbi:ABC transporter, partial [archaeon CG07_land_8_20_14_0_80_38_8]